jgi:hypothetical protein
MDAIDQWWFTPVFSACITFIPFFINEIHVPHVEAILAKEYRCEKAGGEILELRSREDLCIKKESIIDVN